MAVGGNEAKNVVDEKVYCQQVSHKLTKSGKHVEAEAWLKTVKHKTVKHKNHYRATFNPSIL